MNPERWQQVREVLTKAIAVSETERPALLETACSRDPELRVEVESLLRSHQERRQRQFPQEAIFGYPRGAQVVDLRGRCTACPARFSFSRPGGR